MDEELKKAMDRLISRIYAADEPDMEWLPFYTQMSASLNVKEGLPLRVRAALASVRDIQDKLSVLKQFYPDAEAAGGKLLTAVPGKGIVLADEEGFSFKDLIDVSPYAAEIVGGIVGAASGVPLGLPATAAGAGAGASLAREGATRALGLTRPEGDPRDLKEQILEPLGDFAANAIGEGVGTIGVNLAKRAVGGAARAVMPDLGSAAAREATEASVRQGVPTTLGQQTGSRLVQSLEAGAASNPMTSGIMGDFFEKQQKQLVNLSDRIGVMLNPNSAPMDLADAGWGVKRALQGRVDRFNVAREAMELHLEKQIGGDTWVPVNNMMAELAEIRRFGEAGDQLAKANSGDLLKWFEPLETLAAANNGQVPFKELRKVRTNINQSLRPADASGLAKDNLAKAAGILRGDLEAAAQAAGPEAHKTWRALNEYIRSNRDEASEVSIQALTKVLKNNDDIRAYRWALEGTNFGSGKLAELRKGFSNEEWGTLAGTVWDQLGRRNGYGTDWSAATFLRQYERMNPSARRLLFGGDRYAAASVAIDDLVSLAGMRQGSQALANHSGTARSLLGAAMSMTNPKKLIAGATIQGAAARAFTNPAFVRNLTTGVRILDRSPASLPAVLGRIAASLQDDEPALEWFKETFGGLIGDNYRMER
jgi:hypothetical protein